jgi:hypothetical protein
MKLPSRPHLSDSADLTATISRKVSCTRASPAAFLLGSPIGEPA